MPRADSRSRFSGRVMGPRRSSPAPSCNSSSKYATQALRGRIALIRPAMTWISLTIDATSLAFCSGLASPGRQEVREPPGSLAHRLWLQWSRASLARRIYGHGDSPFRSARSRAPPRADHEKRRTAGDPGGFGQLPSVMVVEEVNAELCRSGAGEVELTDLEGIQVAVGVEGLQDRTVSLGERAEKLRRLLLRERSGGVFGKPTKVETTDRNRSPSRGVRRGQVKMRPNLVGPRAALRSLKRRAGKRIVRTEIGSEALLLVTMIRQLTAMGRAVG